MAEDQSSEVRIVTTRVVATIAGAILAVLMATSGFTCTTVCLLEQGRALVAYNYDFHPSEGLVLVNKRGTRKQSRVEPQGASWTARHGSLTFNQFGRDNPTTGVNEQGLMVSLMWLDATGYPPPDHRPAVSILEWIQYHLDQHASVAEVVANAETVRPTSRIPIHYLFADASGDAAAIEFLDGKLVVHRGETLPVKALANSTYADSVAAFEAARRAGEMPTSRSSLDRFVRAAMLASGDGDPMARGFAVLAAVARPGFTRWSIVYDLGAGDVYFKTDTNEAIRRVTVTGFDLSCRTPVQILDVTAPGSGDVTPAFVDYTRAANHALLEASYAKTPFLQGRSDTEKAAAAAHADATSSCTVTD
jgi:penicillin V acylase-like amidase (Ntn superfamily)